jgi:penicillin-binding protein 1A
MLKRWLVYLAAVLAGLGLVGALLVAFVFALLYPTLPSLETLTDYQPKIPLKIVSAEGAILGEFGEERRAIVKIKEVPDVMRQAILAAEDERFYQHGGVDYLSVLRAALANVSGGAPQGAGTITMQVARNFFLTRERTLTRKLREVMLAYKIESNLSKDEILELYINQIFLGQRAYGFAAAAQIYFGKPLQELSIAEAAMLAGLPKAPSAYNPVANPKRPGAVRYTSCGACTSSITSATTSSSSPRTPRWPSTRRCRNTTLMPSSRPKWPARSSSRATARRVIPED